MRFHIFDHSTVGFLCYHQLPITIIEYGHVGRNRVSSESSPFRFFDYGRIEYPILIEGSYWCGMGECDDCSIHRVPSDGCKRCGEGSEGYTHDLFDFEQLFVGKHHPFLCNDRILYYIIFDHVCQGHEPDDRIPIHLGCSHPR